MDRVIGLRIAGDAAQVEKLRAQDALVRRLVRKTQDGTLGKAEGGGAEDEAMGNIRVGDDYFLAPTSGGAGQSGVSGAANPGPLAAGGLPKWLAPLLLLAGGGAGAAIPAAVNWLSGAGDPPAAVKPSDGSGGVGYDLTISSGDGAKPEGKP